MKHWAIDYQNRIATNTWAFETSGGFGLTSGDRVVCFRRGSAGKILFEEFGEVQSISTTALDDGRKRFSVVLTNVQPLNQLTSLEDFSYSLLKVYRFAEPERHFRRRYVYLEQEDFETLEKGRVFWSRTAFALYASRLPVEWLNEFSFEVGRAHPSFIMHPATMRFQDLWILLEEFISSRMFQLRDLTDSVVSAMEAVVERGTEIPIKEISIGGSDGQFLGRIFDKRDQASTFIGGESTTDESGFAVIQRELSTEIVENLEQEKEFEIIFRGTQWPVPRQ